MEVSLMGVYTLKMRLMDEVHGGVEVENMDDGGQVHEVVQSQNEEHRGEVDRGVEVENAHEGDVNKDDMKMTLGTTMVMVQLIMVELVVIILMQLIRIYLTLTGHLKV
ncbi:hypothetical protein DEO72_LG5g2783 [Vigna unguiculata]|uniref:Uncharacterized protein n=1 Tax=Vigna unguiculata TaxID=3917 RepID=A0A4D6M272_VIGUN|nr:hypothetical protein DEO72_LG5g2783 [Vigna unguiculata]